jgi:hypothetical protein
MFYPKPFQVMPFASGQQVFRRTTENLLYLSDIAQETLPAPPITDQKPPTGQPVPTAAAHVDPCYSSPEQKGTLSTTSHPK